MAGRISTSNRGFILLIGALLSTIAFAQGESGDSRTNYYPNTEVLDADEMRVIALGTGTPNFRRSQASEWPMKEVITMPMPETMVDPKYKKKAEN